MPISKLEQFLEKAIAVHGSTYDYSKVAYSIGTSNVEIICREHGPFIQMRGNHVAGKGCKKCGLLKTSKSDFIARSKLKHGDFFDYSLVSFLKTRDKVQIICPEHGSFFQQARDHMRGIGCRECSNEKSRVTFQEFLKRAKARHGDKFTYNESYWTGDARTVIECPKHGEFSQFWYNHTIGDGCLKCTRLSFDDFLSRSTKVHGDTYDYSKVVFVSASEKVTIICRKHGDFEVQPYSHMNGTNCAKCAFGGISKGEQALADFIKSREIEAIQSDYSVLDGKEIDIFIPLLNIGFEFNGDFWHSDAFIQKKKGITAREYHTQKLTGAASAGVNLYFVWESDWINSRSLIESAVTSIITAAQSNQSPDSFSVKLLSKLENPIELEEFTETEETLLAVA